jgi:hypothetical protein
MHSLVIRLLCVLLLTAALDRVPDPPSVKPKNDNASVVSSQRPLALTNCGNLAHQQTWSAASQKSLLTSKSRWVAFLVLLNPRTACALRLDGCHAADSSPPSLFA